MNNHTILFVADNPPSVGVVAVTPVADDDIAFAPEACDDLPQLCCAKHPKRFLDCKRTASDEVGQDAGLWLSQIFLHSLDILRFFVP